MVLIVFSFPDPIPILSTLAPIVVPPLAIAAAISAHDRVTPPKLTFLVSCLRSVLIFLIRGSVNHCWIATSIWPFSSSVSHSFFSMLDSEDKSDTFIIITSLVAKSLTLEASKCLFSSVSNAPTSTAVDLVFMRTFATDVWTTWFIRFTKPLIPHILSKEIPRYAPLLIPLLPLSSHTPTPTTQFTWVLPDSSALFSFGDQLSHSAPPVVTPHWISHNIPVNDVDNDL